MQNELPYYFNTLNQHSPTKTKRNVTERTLTNWPGFGSDNQVHYHIILLLVKERHQAIALLSLSSSNHVQWQNHNYKHLYWNSVQVRMSLDKNKLARNWKAMWKTNYLQVQQHFCLDIATVNILATTLTTLDSVKSVRIASVLWIYVPN
jgi:hypothetical protein